MKKKLIIAIISALAVIIALGLILPEASDPLSTLTPETSRQETTAEDGTTVIPLFSQQYLIYAPKNALVTLDGRAVAYSESLGCFAAYEKSGSYDLKITCPGCEDLVSRVEIGKDKTRFDATLQVSENHLTEGKAAAEDILREIFSAVSQRNDSLENISFASPQDKSHIEGLVADIIYDMQSREAPGYLVEKLKIKSLSVRGSDANNTLTDDKEDFSLYFAFDIQYTYSLAGNQRSVRHTPHLYIEKVGDSWCLKDLYLKLIFS